MKLGIISTLSGNPWGGSEELWFAVASTALTRGDEVAICVPRTATSHAKFVQIRNAGATVFSIDRSLIYRISMYLGKLDRALSRLKPKDTSTRMHPTTLLFSAARELIGRVRQATSITTRLIKWMPDVVLISEGGSIPGEEVIDDSMRLARHAPYSVVCHNNFGIIFDADARKKATKFFEDAAKTFFVATATQRMTERQLAAPVVAQIIRNPVNLSDTSFLPWPSRKPLKMLCVGHLRPEWKGQDLLLEALSSPSWNAREWSLDLVGTGSNKEYLQELVRFYRLEHRVKIVGHASDIRHLWTNAHLLVVASRVESAPLVIVEAMLLGRPVVATDVGGITEWIDDGQTGFIAEGATSQSIRGALERAWTNRDELEAMGNRARMAAAARFDADAAATLLHHLDEIAIVKGQPPNFLNRSRAAR